MAENKKIAFAYISLVFAQIFWGISFVWTKELINNGFNVIFIITTRLVISFLLLYCVTIVAKQAEKIRRNDYPKFLLLAFFEPFLYFIGENYGLKYVDASYASIFIAIIPVLVPFGMWLCYREKLNWSTLLGVLISIIGITVLSMGNSASGQFHFIGMPLLLLAVLSAVGYNIILFKLLCYKPITIVIYQNIIGTVFYLPLFFFIDKSEFSSMTWNIHTIFALVLLAIFCSSLAFMCYSYTVKTIHISKASAFTNAIPVITIIFAVLIGQETLTFYKILGMIIVISGVAISQSLNIKLKRDC
jgi:drug/metabolite transporter (DMT)-like permease